MSRPSPNGWKASIMLEETGLPYEVRAINLGANDQKAPDYLRLNPNGRIPAIVDNDGPGNAPLSVFESGAILWYLAEKFSGLMPESPVERIRALEYTFFQVGGVGPMFGQAGWFMRHSEPMPLAVARYQTESNRLTAVLEARLQVSPWLAGESYSVADIMNFGWLRAAQYAGVQLDNYPAVRAWVTRMAARPAVIRGLQAIA